MRKDDGARGGKLVGGGGSAKGNPLGQKFQQQIIVTKIPSKSKDFRAWVRVRNARPLGDCVEILRKSLKSSAQARKWRSTPGQNRPIILMRFFKNKTHFHGNPLAIPAEERKGEMRGEARAGVRGIP